MFSISYRGSFSRKVSEGFKAALLMEYLLELKNLAAPSDTNLSSNKALTQTNTYYTYNDSIVLMTPCLYMYLHLVELLPHIIFRN